MCRSDATLKTEKHCRNTLGIFEKQGRKAQSEAMDRQKYLQNPSRASSLSFWKTNHMQVPDNIRIFTDETVPRPLPAGYEDEPYFKMVHHLGRVADCALDHPFIFREAAVEEYANHINACYVDERISTEELLAYRARPVYDASLWLSIYDTANGRLAASGIAEYDSGIREGSLEWIQVSPEYRRLGLGREMVNALLRRLKGRAAFVTVSGRVNHTDKPERLYEACGFQDKTIWHVLKRK